jgi:Tesmin/TSO1-like CXC domain, cysteine-rich domain
MCDTFVDFKIDGSDDSTKRSPESLNGALTPVASEITNPDRIDTFEAFDKENKEQNPSCVHSMPSRMSPPRTVASFSYSKRDPPKNDEATFYPIPMGPPMMSYASSAAFSDISMPIHDLTASKSFGPSGMFGGSPSDPPSLKHSASTTESEASGAFTAPRYPVGVRLTVDEINQKNYPQSVKSEPTLPNHSLGDLSLAASALLDLTPAVNQCRQPPDHGQFGRRFLLKHRPPLAPPDQHSHYLPGLAGSLAHVQAFNSRMSERAYRLLNNVPTTYMACKCKNTKCLKLYCTCFQAGAFCDGTLCRCQDCHNSAEHSKPRGRRTHAIYEILSRRLDAFEPRLRKKTGRGCSCKKSRYVFIYAHHRCPSYTT